MAVAPGLSAMADTLLIEHGIGELRLAEIKDGHVVGFGFENPDDPLGPGRCHLGRITRLEPALQAAFVDLGGGAGGFLSTRRLPPGVAGDRGNRPLFEGQKLLVQVRRGPAGDKSAELSARPEIAGIALVYRPMGAGVSLSNRIGDPAERDRLARLLEPLLDGDGFIVRTAAVGAQETALAAEAGALKAAWRDLMKAAEHGQVGPLPDGPYDQPVVRLVRSRLTAETRQILVDTAADQALLRRYLGQSPTDAEAAVALHTGAVPLFVEYGAEAALEAALEPEVVLPGGGRLLIEATRALTAIDIDTGADTGGASPAASRRAVNLAAARAIPGELRRRQIGGLVVIDFLKADGQKTAAEGQILKTLKAGFADDTAHVQLGRFSALGLVDLARQGDGPSLAARLAGPAAGAKRLLRQALAEARAAGPGAIAITAPPAIAAHIDRQALDELGRRTGRRCRLETLGHTRLPSHGTVAIL